MPDAANAAPVSRRPRRSPGSTARRVGIALVAVAVLLTLALAGLYLNRRAAAREALVGWLDDRGIEAVVEVDDIGPTGFVGRIRIGDPQDPDFVVERAEVDYAIALPWSAGGMGVSPRRIRLIRPILKARWIDGEFSLGSLDPLIEEFTGRPPRPDATAPVVLVETGRVRLTTEYGTLQVLADARLEDNKLMRLSARLPASALRSGDITARVDGAALEVTTTGDRAAVRLSADLKSLTVPGLSTTDAALNLTGDLPYPDLKGRRGDGPVRLDGELTAARLQAGGLDGRDARGVLAFQGTNSGWIDAFRLIGGAEATLSAQRLTGSGLSGRSMTARAVGGQFTVARNPRGVEWRLDSPLALTAAALSQGGMRYGDLAVRSRGLVAGGRNGAFEATGPLAVSSGRFQFNDLSLRRVTGDLALDLVHDGATLITATGGLKAAGGAWPLFGPTGENDPEELKALKAAMGDFNLAAPGLRLTAGSPGLEVALTRPVVLSPSNGGRLTVSPTRAALYEAEPGRLGGGAFTLTSTRGRGLPEAAFSVPRWRLTESGFSADLDGRAALDFATGRGIALSTRGRLTSGGGRLTYAAAACVPVTVDRLELGDNDAIDLSGDLCPSDAPLVAVAAGRWRAVGTLRDVGGEVPFLGTRISGAAGALRVDGSKDGLTLDVRVDRATLDDTITPRRFHPLTATGRATLANDQWDGRFDLAARGHTLGQVSLTQDGRLGTGAAVIDAPDLTFSAQGLQPQDITPLVQGLMEPPVEGTARFNGRFDWTPLGVTSGGVAATDGLDFVSPLGPISGLKGSVAFTSLTPLISAPGQTLTIDGIAAFAPFSDAAATFELREGSARVSGGRIGIGGGVLSVEPFDLPFDRDQPITGVIVLERVQLGDLLAASGFADKVAMDALVSGRLPFVSDAAGVRITGGALSAVAPGRLSIQREALTGLQAGGGGDVPPNTVQDLAYQAMENLSFDILSAEVNSLPEGRLGVLFRIKGRHDPPEQQELRVTLSELISREFLNRSLPLPSGTEIDLTLDTTLNINELMSDLIAVDRARRGEDDPVEPATSPEP